VLASALWLLAAFLSMAGLAGWLVAGIVAALWVLAAAGAIVVLILFVVMLVSPAEEIARLRSLSFAKILAAAAAGYLAVVMAIAVLRPPFLEVPASGESFESPVTLGRLLSGRYAIPFEIAGLLLLVAVVAVVLLLQPLPPALQQKESGADWESFS
jgi:NADH-quinone oxidoreductase subunit J